MKVLGPLYLLMIISFSVSAQSLKVGDNAAKISGVEWIKGKPISNFKKGEVYIVELGATWCVPCAKAIPELTKIAKKYASDKVNVLGFFVLEQKYEKEGSKSLEHLKKIKQYVAKKGESMNYSVAVDLSEKYIEQHWFKASGSTGIPTTFIIDRQGKVAFISNDYMATEANLKRVLSDNYDLSTIVQENAINNKTKFDYDKLWLINNNGGPDSVFLFRSVMGLYDGTIRFATSLEIISYYDDRFYPDSIYGSIKGRVQEIGVGLDMLYRMAYTDTISMYYTTRSIMSNEYPDTTRFPHMRTVYGKWWPRVVPEVSDPEIFKWSMEYVQNRFNYSLKVPREVATGKFLKETMQRDLQTYFGYNVTVETRTMPCWKIVATSETSQKLKRSPDSPTLKSFETAKGFRYEHTEIRDIISRFEWAFGSLAGNKEAIPFIDATGIDYHFEYDIYNEEEFLAMQEKKDFEAGKRFLNRIGLDIIKGEIPMKVIVIRD